MSVVSDGGTIIAAPFSSNSSFSPTLTFFYWVNFASTPAGQTPLGISGTVSGHTGGCSIYSAGSGTHTFNMIQLADSGSSIAANASTAPSTGIWYPLLGTVTFGSSCTILSTLGSQTTTGSASTQTWNQIQALATQGSGAAADIVASGGKVAECAIWTTILSPSEQQALVFQGKSPFNVRRDQLLTYLPFRENTQDYGPNHFAYLPAGTGGITFSGDHPIIDGVIPPSRVFLSGGIPIITGGLTQTQGAQLVSSTGKVLIGGALTQTQGTQLVSSTGKVLIGGALTQTQGTQLVSSTGKVLIGGVLTETQGAQLLSGTGTVSSGAAITGTLAATQGTQLISSSGGVLISGALEENQRSQTIVAAGTVSGGTSPITGSLVATQGAQTISAFGDVLESDDMLTTAQDYINFALKASGALGVGQTALAEDNSDALSALNGMLGQWMRQRWLSWHLTDNAFTSTGAISYSVGPGGNFNLTSRPNRLESAFFRQFINSTPNQVDYPLDILQSREDYNLIALKSLPSWPQYIFYDSAWPLGYVYPWPIPQAGIYELHLSFRDGPGLVSVYTQILNLPPEYQEAIWSNLCLRLAPLYGFSVSEDIKLLAKNSLQVIRSSNAQISRLRMPTFLKRDGLYNIFSDTSY